MVFRRYVIAAIISSLLIASALFIYNGLVNKSANIISETEKSLIGAYPGYVYSNQEIFDSEVADLKNPLEEYQCLLFNNPCVFEASLNPDNLFALSVKLNKSAALEDLNPPSGKGFQTSASLNFFSNKFVQDYLLSGNVITEEENRSSGLWLVVPTKLLLNSGASIHQDFPLKIHQDLLFFSLSAVYNGMDESEKADFLKNIDNIMMKLVFYYSYGSYLQQASNHIDDPLFESLQESVAISEDNRVLLFALLKTFPKNVVLEVFNEAGSLDVVVNNTYGVFIDRPVSIFIDENNMGNQNPHSVELGVSLCVGEEHYLCDFISSEKNSVSCFKWSVYSHLCNDQNVFLKTNKVKI